MVLVFAHPRMGNFGKSIIVVSLKFSLQVSLLFGILFSSFWDPFLILLASWARKDYSFSSSSFESLRCNLRSILLSCENDLSF